MTKCKFCGKIVKMSESHSYLPVENTDPVKVEVYHFDCALKKNLKDCGE